MYKWIGRGERERERDEKGLYINGRGFMTLASSYPYTNTVKYIRPCANKVE